jgi:hypothetical protein
MKPAVCEMFFGLGNAVTDTASGEPALAVRVRSLGVKVPPIWNYTDQPAAARAIEGIPEDTLLFAIAISCGANGLAYLLQLCRKRVFAGVYAIAPSVYCNSGQPAIGDNAPNFWVFNGPWVSLPFPGLSAYQPQRAEGSKAPPIVRRKSAASHPCDFDVANVQDPIIADIKRKIA